MCYRIRLTHTSVGCSVAFVYQAIVCVCVMGILNIHSVYRHLARGECAI